MYKTLVPLILLWTLEGALRAAQQTKPNPAAKPLSACAVVTKAEIEQAIGITMGNGMPHRAREADVCAYENKKGNKVNIFVTRSQEKRNLNTLVDDAKKALPKAKVQELRGLGEKALLVEDPKGPTILSIYRGGDVLVVSVYGISNRTTAEAAVEKIARKAFRRF
jgi:hypothetical protein